jgi:hypothetical protein
MLVRNTYDKRFGIYYTYLYYYVQKFILFDFLKLSMEDYHTFFINCLKIIIK